MPYTAFHTGTCHYTKTGTGPALLLVHGLGSSCRDWEDQRAFLSKSYTTIAVDLPGHGQSSPLGKRFELGSIAAQLLAVLNSEGITTAHIIGLSLGGAVALQLALDAPDRVLSLAIANSRACFKPQNWQDKLHVWQRLGLIRTLGPAALSHLLAKRLFPNSSALRKRFIQRSRNIDKTAYLDTFNALLRWDIREHLHEIQCPTLIVAAEHDYLPPSKSRALAKAIPNACFKIIPHAHHAVCMERPEEFNHALENFLSSLTEHRRHDLN